MKAILSDIHANLEALTSVLADIARFPVESIYCLGDVVGYGPNPRECFDLVTQFAIVLRGDCDDLVDPGVSHDVRGWSVATHRMVRWTQAELAAPAKDSDGAASRFGYLGSLKPRHQEDAVLFVHGSPKDPLNGYVFPEDVYNSKKIASIFSLFEGICFNGHSHIPGVFTQASTSYPFEFLVPEQCDFIFPVESRRVICNVGSVGQPRDGDPRACYVLYDGETLRFRRVDYDVEKTVRKIQSNPDLGGSSP